MLLWHHFILMIRKIFSARLVFLMCKRKQGICHWWIRLVWFVMRDFLELSELFEMVWKKKIVRCSKVCGNFSIIRVVISNILRSLLENNFLKNIYVTIRFFGLGFLFCRTPYHNSHNYLLESRTNIAKNSNKKNNFFNYFFRSIAPICIFSVVSNVFSSQYLWNGHSRELC